MTNASPDPDTHTPSPFRLGGVVHWLPKPSETFILEEIRALHRLHPELELFTLYGPWRHRLSPALSTEGLSVHRMGLRGTGRILRDIAFWFRRNGSVSRRLWHTIPFRKWSDLEMAGENVWAFLCGFSLARQAQEIGLTHLHAWWGNGPATAAWTASQLTGIPFSFSTWAGDVFPPDGALQEKIQAAQWVRSTCQTFVPHLEHFADGKTEIHLIYNGQDPDRFPHAAPKLQTPLRLLALGRFVPKKGYEHALKAVALLRDAGQSVSLTLAGDGPQKRKLKKRIRELDLQNQVHMAGFVPRDRVPELFQQCDVFLMPSQVDPHSDRDGIPNVIMEALLSGIPVVGSDVGAIGELIQNDQTGFLLPPGNPQAIADAIQAIGQDPAKALSMAEAGRARVRQQHDLATSARKLLKQLMEDPSTAGQDPPSFPADSG